MNHKNRFRDYIMRKRIYRVLLGLILIKVCVFQGGFGSILCNAPAVVYASTIKPISINERITESVEYEWGGDYKSFFSFALPEDGYISLSLSPETLKDSNEMWGWIVLDDDLNEVDFDSITNQEISNSGGTYASVRIGVEKGNYRLGIYWYNDEGSPGERKNLTFSVKYAQSDDWEKGISSNKTLTLNEKMYGTLRGGSNIDEYSVFLPEDGVVQVTLENGKHKENGEIGVYIEDTERNRVMSFSNAGSETSYTTLKVGMKRGTYILRVSSWKISSHTEYSLKVSYYKASDWEKEPNNFDSTRNRLSVGESIYGSFFVNEDEDEFEIDIPQKGTICLEMSVSEKNSSAISMKISGGNLVNPIVFRHNEEGPNFKNVYDLDAGKYIITLSGSCTEYLFCVGYCNDMYRLYNPNSGEHFYTAKSDERDNLTAVGWTYEGEAWMSPDQSGLPVYRLYNPNSGEHHYTTSVGERDSLVTIGWNDEGIGWYSAPESGTPLYRLYNPNATGAQEAGAHHYTKEVTERDYLVSIGWNYEGVGWYGL